MNPGSGNFWARFAPQRRRALYEQWVRAYAADLYRMAYRLCGAADTAEDLVQETFYEAWKDMTHLRDPRKARAWLFQVPLGTVLSRIHRARKHLRAVLEAQDQRSADVSAGPRLRLRGQA